MFQADTTADSPNNKLDNRPGLVKPTSNNQPLSTTTPKLSPVYYNSNICVTEECGDQAEYVGEQGHAGYGQDEATSMVAREDDGPDDVKSSMKAYSVPNINVDVPVEVEDDMCTVYRVHLWRNAARGTRDHVVCCLMRLWTCTLKLVVRGAQLKLLCKCTVRLGCM